MKKTTERWIWLSVGIISVILAIISYKTIDWLTVLGIPLFLWLLLLGITSFFALYLTWIPPREAKVYQTSLGLPDTKTERVYEAKKLYFGQGFISRGIKFALPWSTLKTFWVKDGWIGVETKSGKVFEAPLSKLRVRYQIENDKIAGYSLKETEYEEKITIYYPGLTFEEEEWKDIAGVLSQADDVGESRMSKISRWMMKVKDLDFGDVVGSVVTDYAADSLVNFATSDSRYLNTRKGKIKRIIKKSLLWLLIVFSLLSIIWDVWMQIEMHRPQQAVMDEQQAIMAEQEAAYRLLNNYGQDEETEGDELAVTEQTYHISPMGFKTGYNDLSGNMIHTDGRKFPIRLSFSYNSSTGNFSDIVYTNIGSGTKMRLSAEMIDVNKVRMAGRDGGKDFIMVFEGSGPYYGDAWWGDFHQDLELYKPASSLLDLVDKDYLADELTVYKIGKNMDKVYNETGSTHRPLKATGMISDHNLTLEGWLTEEGSIHGRYHNENGINLDFNGLLYPNGDLYIQLGHGSEKSDWYLHAVPHELNNAYRYEGTWGKKSLPSYVVFYVNDF